MPCFCTHFAFLFFSWKRGNLHKKKVTEKRMPPPPQAGHRQEMQILYMHRWFPKVVQNFFFWNFDQKIEVLESKFGQKQKILRIRRTKFIPKWKSKFLHIFDMFDKLRLMRENFGKFFFADFFRTKSRLSNFQNGQIRDFRGFRFCFVTKSHL